MLIWMCDLSHKVSNLHSPPHPADSKLGISIMSLSSGGPQPSLPAVLTFIMNKLALTWAILADVWVIHRQPWSGNISFLLPVLFQLYFLEIFFICYRYFIQLFFCCLLLRKATYICSYSQGGS